MCGRFILTSDKDVLEKSLKVKIKLGYAPRYNVAPTQNVMTVTDMAPDGITFMKWGMEPAWWKFKSRQLINLRVETVRSKPFFQRLLAHGRCAMLADGFYEWDKSSKPSQPYLFRFKSGAPFFFPAVWEQEGGVSACSLLTVPANPLVGKIHNRMPAILELPKVKAWLQSDASLDALLDLVEPYPSSKMIAVKVGQAVNDPHLDSAALVEAV